MVCAIALLLGVDYAIDRSPPITAQILEQRLANNAIFNKFQVSKLKIGPTECVTIPAYRMDAMG
jgi:hypothetical protein